MGFGTYTLLLTIYLRSVELSARIYEEHSVVSAFFFVIADSYVVKYNQRPDMDQIIV